MRAEIERHLISTYPREGCGLILRRGGAFRVQPMTNAYDRFNALDPVRYPRSTHTAYVFDSGEWLRVSQAADAAGEEVVCIFHSHCDAGAYFSREDRAMAAPEGEPLMPGVAYLVVAVDRGRVTDSKLFSWKVSDFAEVDCKASGLPL